MLGASAPLLLTAYYTGLPIWIPDIDGPMLAFTDKRQENASERI
jgi:hypothetical protein